MLFFWRNVQSRAYIGRVVIEVFSELFTLVDNVVDNVLVVAIEIAFLSIAIAATKGKRQWC
jgi:hypothetical protein